MCLAWACARHGHVLLMGLGRHFSRVCLTVVIEGTVGLGHVPVRGGRWRGRRRGRRRAEPEVELVLVGHELGGVQVDQGRGRRRGGRQRRRPLSVQLRDPAEVSVALVAAAGVRGVGGREGGGASPLPGSQEDDGAGAREGGGAVPPPGCQGEGGGGQQHVWLDTAQSSSFVTKDCGRSASPAPSGRGRGRC